MRVVRFDDVTSFAARAEPWLLEREAEHNLLLGIVNQLRGGHHAYQSPTYLAVMEDGGRVVGCAFRTPPFGVGLTRMPLDAVSLLVNDVHRVYESIPRTVGPPELAKAFSVQWADRTGCQWRSMMRQRIYALTRVHFPTKPPPGVLRLAVPGDIALVESWAESFVRDTHVGALGNEQLAPQLIAEQALYIWDDGQPRSMAAARGPTPNGIRIGFVYTPDEFRGRGYASACVAGVSQVQLDAGRTFCFLYTDLANPTSNSIYSKMGYEPVCDSLMTEFAH
jgi:hypothetical protein